MERDVRPRRTEGLDDQPELATAERLGAEQTFSTTGEIPPVAVGGQQGPSASDRAYGPVEQVSPQLTNLVGSASVEQVAAILADNPNLASSIIDIVKRVRGQSFTQQAITFAYQKPIAPATADHAAKPAPPAPVPVAVQPIDPARQKIVDRQMTAGWEQVARYTPDERATPEHIRLPKNVVNALDRAWQDSLKESPEKEQGGNLVQNYGGDYEVRRGKPFNPGTFEPDDRDVGRTQTLVGSVHTHPYRDEKDKVPEQFATFSDGDFAALFSHEGHMALLRSGPYTFALSRTKQFDALAARFAGRPDYEAAFAKQMADEYNEAFDRTQGLFSEKCEAGVIAVCARFHLVYYAGQGSDLTRKSVPRPERKPEED